MFFQINSLFQFMINLNKFGLVFGFQSTSHPIARVNSEILVPYKF